MQILNTKQLKFTSILNKIRERQSQSQETEAIVKQIISNVKINYSGNLTGTGSKSSERTIEIEYSSGDFGSYTSYKNMPKANPFIYEDMVYNVTTMADLEKKLTEDFIGFAKNFAALQGAEIRNRAPRLSGFSQNKRWPVEPMDST